MKEERGLIIITVVVLLSCFFNINKSYGCLSVDVNAEPIALPADGASTARIDIFVYDWRYNPVIPQVGEPLSINIVYGAGSLSAHQAITDSAGRASVIYTAASNPSSAVIEVWTQGFMSYRGAEWIVSYKVDFLKKGTGEEISAVYVASDGDINTTLTGEEAEFDIRVEPAQFRKTFNVFKDVDLDVEYRLETTEAKIEPAIGHGLVTAKITGEGQPTAAELKVILDRAYYYDGTESIELAALPVYVVKVEFFEHGTTNEISEAHVGTDGDSATTKDGENKEIDVKITPSDVTVDFSLDNTEVDITPISGNGTTIVTIIGKGNGTKDSKIKVKKGDIELNFLDVCLHRPSSLDYVNSTPVSPSVNYVGEGREYYYDVYDVRGRIIPLEGFNIYERLHIDKNEDGKGGYFKSNITNILHLEGTPLPGIVLPDVEFLADNVHLFIEEGTSTIDLTTDAIMQWHNSFYMMDIYLQGSTYQYTWTTEIVGDIVVDLDMQRLWLNDSQKVTAVDDDID
ncbi:MAG: hypothetical protein KJ893_10260 [Candidatus Omnitrophica bacterium]|nr:hypothetical protein [Candidatus Omnitrophota bacterium]MBU4478555.1 hypothetical protein [Candidatus Omnitrophota bacterium]MCG2703398.1 hypothetical protein [Candidatus Omnitrophota bacterium]